ncbi:MAG: hypothetical protein QOH62_3009 [Solirubrobacteraceae bacterium]|jgi:uncharacterized SAM-binding protein YcdF (DUF218 family)|nr:hypothetical protein [Solirubrobacteraceae bacterium]
MLLWSFALLVLAWMLLQALTGTETGLLYLAPALVLALPLLGGHYVGEEHLANLVQASRAPAVRAVKILVATHAFVRTMQRGGRLVASSMAKRPPPAPAPFIAA